MSRGGNHLSAFDVRVELGPTPASRVELLTEIGPGLDEFAPRLSQTGTAFELSLTVLANDLWVAVLSAMAAITDTGYDVVQLEARRSNG